jgi:hypothetical protein
MQLVAQEVLLVCMNDCGEATFVWRVQRGSGEQSEDDLRPGRSRALFFSADGQLTLDLIVCSSPDSLLVSITRHAKHTFRVRDHLAYLRSRIAQEVLLVCMNDCGEATFQLVIERPRRPREE